MALPVLNNTIHLAVSLFKQIPKIRVQRDVNSQIKSLSSFFHFELPTGINYTDDQGMTTTTLEPLTTTMDTQPTESSVTTTVPEE